MKTQVTVEVDIDVIASEQGGALQMGTHVLITWQMRNVVGSRYPILECSNGKFYSSIEDLKHEAIKYLAEQKAEQQIKGIFKVQANA